MNRGIAVLTWTALLVLSSVYCQTTDSSAAQAWSSHSIDDETNLKAALLNDSGVAGVRPRRTTLIELSFNLISVNHVDIKNEQFGVSGYWSMEWLDERLGWKDVTSLAQYSTIPVIQVRNNEVWTPALVVDNSVNDLSAIEESSIPLRIRKDGKVSWNPPGILTTACEMVVTHFPFDTQTCSIQVTSFGYTIQELNISVRDTGLNQAYFQPNGEWDLEKTWNARSEFTEEDYQYAKTTFFLKLRRRAVYYGLNTLLPVLLTSLLIPLVFLLPHDAGEKIGYCLTVLLAFVVLLTLITDGLPKTAKSQSLLGVYIALVLSLSAISVVLAIHSLEIFHRSPDKPVPGWQASLVSKLRRVLHPCGPSGPRDSPGRVSPLPPKEDLHPHNLYNHGSVKDPVGRLKEGMHMSPDSTRRRGGGGGGVSPYRRGSSHLTHVSATNVQAHMNYATGSEGEAAGHEDEMSWQLVAKTYDAFFLRLYFFVIVAFTLVILLVLASNQF